MGTYNSNRLPARLTRRLRGLHASTLTPSDLLRLQSRCPVRLLSPFCSYIARYSCVYHALICTDLITNPGRVLEAMSTHSTEGQSPPAEIDQWQYSRVCDVDGEKEEEGTQHDQDETRRGESCQHGQSFVAFVLHFCILVNKTCGSPHTFGVPHHHIYRNRWPSQTAASIRITGCAIAHVPFFRSRSSFSANSSVTCLTEVLSELLETQ